MTHYLLSTYTVEGEPSTEAPPPEANQAMMDARLRGSRGRGDGRLFGRHPRR